MISNHVWQNIFPAFTFRKLPVLYAVRVLGGKEKCGMRKQDILAFLGILWYDNKVSVFAFGQNGGVTNGESNSGSKLG